jgi:hypothetical protein
MHTSTSHRIATSLTVVLVAALFASVTACKPAGPEYPAARLAGSVSIAGAPISEGRVHFMPNAGTPGTPVTAEISAGNYIANSVPLGNVTVTFSAAKETGNMVREANREPYPEIVSIIPPQYSQGISLSVTGDNDAQDFALVTNKP